MTTRYGSFIDGRQQAAVEGALYVEKRNPADTADVIGLFLQSDENEVDRAVQGAAQQASAWASSPAPLRVQLLSRVIDALEGRQQGLAELMTREQGKPLAESLGEIRKAVSESRFMVGEGLRLYGDTVPGERAATWAHTIRIPIGPVAAITPWNFPVLTPMRKLMPALVAGNPVVFKPSELTPLTGLQLAALFYEAGLPAGVLNAVTGGRKTGEVLVAHPDIRAVTFTGSTTVGRAIYMSAAQRLVRVQAEMGGKNPAVVWNPPNMAQAAQQITLAAFQCAGQRCTAISRVIVPRTDAEELAAALAAHMNQLVPGNGLKPGVTLGPLISGEHLHKVAGYVDRAVAAGARLLLGGRALRGEGYDSGHFYAPTLLTDVEGTMEIAREEVFGPVLCIQPADSFEQAMQLVNDTSYGLTAAIFTKELELAGRFIDHVQSGMVHVNHGTVPESHMPFGGIKDSGVGPGSVGATAKQFYTDVKTVYLKYV